MIKHNLELFPTLVSVYENYITDAEAKRVFDYCKSLEKTAVHHGAIQGPGVSSYQVSQDLLTKLEQEFSEWKNINQRLLEVANEYSNKIGLRNCVMANSWYNFQQPGSILKQHNHAGSRISGALYINVDSQSSNLYFDNPNNYMDYIEVDPLSDSKYVFSTYFVNVDIGMLVLFPSWLRHGSLYQENKTEDRLVLSFNTSIVT